MEERGPIAETLRKARERLELTIERAAADAGVPLRYARLLEGEKPSGIGVSDELYLIPFFRRYAAALGLPAEELLPDFLGHVQELPPPSSVSMQARRRSRARAFGRPLLVLLAIAAASYVILQQTPERPRIDDDHWSDTDRAGEVEDKAAGDSGAATAPGVDATRNSAGTGEPSGDSARAADGAVGAVRADGSAQTEKAPAAPAAALPAVVAAEPRPDAAGAVANAADSGAVVAAGSGRELRIVAAEETWLALAIDDEPQRNILLQPGETRSWTAARAFTLTVGNAGGITVSLDGHELPPLGRSGQVVRKLRLPPGEAAPASG